MSVILRSEGAEAFGVFSIDSASPSYDVASMAPDTPRAALEKKLRRELFLEVGI